MSQMRDSFLPPRWVLTTVLVAVMLWLVVHLKELVVLLVVAFFLAYAIEPILRWLESKRLSRSLGLVLVFLALLGIVVLSGATAIPTIIDEFVKLSDNFNSYLQTSKDRVGPIIERVRDYLPEAIQRSVDVEDIRGSITSMMSSISGDTLKNVGRAVVQTLLRGYSQALTLFNILLLPFFVFYISVDLPKIYSLFRNLFPVAKRVKVDTICGEIDTYVSAFVRGQAIVCFILFVLYAIGLGFVGVDLWLLLAAITGFGNMVPYLGTAIGIFLSSIMAVVTFGDLAHVTWVWGVFALVQFLEGMIITPRVMGESVGLSPLAIMLSLFAGGQLFGLLGVFLAIPAAATLRVLVRHSLIWARDN